MTLRAPCLPALALLALACERDDPFAPEELEAIHDDVCRTASGDEANSARASRDPATAPLLTADRDALWRIDLDDLAPGERRYVELRVERERPEAFLFFSRPVGVAILPPEGPEAEVFHQGPSGCEAVSFEHVSELSAGDYLIELTATEPMAEVEAVFTVG